MDSKQPKSHHKKSSGPKSDKKAKKNAQKNNPRAFTFQSGVRADKAIRRSLEKDQKKLHVPLIDRTPTEAPPFVVAVVGPPQSGKTTLIRSLIKRYTKHSLNEIKGPITVVTGKNKRLTFMECNNDISSMIDIAKVADLVLLLIDASFGFEMETFEFLNILQAHGFPKILGVLTHLDQFKDNKRLRKVKKTLKQRFWTEIYKGAKLFYLSGISNGKYPKTEILNLSRFISVMKFRPLIWRNSHPFMLADRVEDLTDPELIRLNPKCDRKVTFYGYLRGTNLKNNAKVHIPGVGDVQISNISILSDPCPFPDKTKKLLSEKHKLLYAPMSDVSGISYDKDAVYIHVPGIFSKAKDGQENSSETVNAQPTTGEKLVMNLQDVNETFQDQIEASELRLFKDSNPIKASSIMSRIESVNVDDGHRIRRRAVFKDETISDGENATSDDESSNSMHSDEEEAIQQESENEANESKEALAFAESDSEFEMESESEMAAHWKSNLHEQAKESFENNKRINLMSLVYETNSMSSEEEEEIPQEDSGNLFSIKKSKKKSIQGLAALDTSKVEIPTLDLAEWSEEEQLESIRHRFITADVTTENQQETFDDFEDLETGEKVVVQEETEEEKLAKKKEALKLKFDQQYDGDDSEENENFYEATKEKIAKQLQFNVNEFSQDDAELKAQVEGFRSGYYLRIVIEKMPCEFIEHFEPENPIIIGGILATEETFGLVRVRIKKHRWYKKILKTNDPLIFSMGWRRFQSLPLYSIDDNSHNRMLKYTPEHMHCLATFYAPITPPNTGFCAFQSVSEMTSSFRVSATGVVLDINQGTDVVKKLKLTGVPMKIYKNTAFIKDMFSSALEVSKFEGASIRTVSGIRGQVKKHLSKPEGCFRATFEDKILMSDIVFLRAWYPVKPKLYCNPVTSLLLGKNKKWTGMRITADIRKEKGILIPSNSDSNYKPIERLERRFNKLHIPKSLQAQLPFSSKPKLMKKQSKRSLMQKRAVVLEPKEKKIYRMIQSINTIRNEKEAKRKAKIQESRKIYMEKKAKTQQLDHTMDKQRRKEFYKSMGKSKPEADAPMHSLHKKKPKKSA